MSNSNKKQPRFLIRSLRVGSKSAVFIEENSSGENEAVVKIQIGADHEAKLTMSEEAFEAYISMQPVHIETVQEHFKN